MSCLFNVLYEVCTGVRGRHSRIHKADQIGDGVVAEDEVHLGGAALEAMNVVKLLGVLQGKAAGTVAGKVDSEGATEDTFIGGHPLHSQILGDGQNFFGDAAFRRPHTDWTNAENLLVQIKPAFELLAGIFAMEKTVLRQGQSG